MILNFLLQENLSLHFGHNYTNTSSNGGSKAF